MQAPLALSLIRPLKLETSNSYLTRVKDIGSGTGHLSNVKLDEKISPRYSQDRIQLRWFYRWQVRRLLPTIRHAPRPYQMQRQ